MLLVVAPIPASADRPTNQREDVLGQGGDGVYRVGGASLTRKATTVRVAWKVRTPEPGSYDYPTADQVPPGVTHPPVTPGHPEVYTLWAFVFNYPDLCSVPCNSDDLGNTPARGGAYQASSTIARGKWIRMLGRFRVGQEPFVGVPLEAPLTAEVHVAMAPHGMALSGDDLATQRSVPIGSPALWWPAIFLTP